MASVEPLRSIISILSVDDTSLALPSADQHRSGQQRVMEQVKSMRKTKSKMYSSSSSSSRSGSTPLSPTSKGPIHDYVFADPQRSPLTKSSGDVFIGNGLSKTLGQDKSVNWQAARITKETTVKRSREASNYQSKMSNGPLGSMAVSRKNRSRSEPNMTGPLSNPIYSARKRFLSNRNTYRPEMVTGQVPTSPTSPSQFHFMSTMTGKARTRTLTGIAQTSTMNGTAQTRPMTGTTLTKSMTGLPQTRTMNGAAQTRTMNGTAQTRTMTGKTLTKSMTGLPQTRTMNGAAQTRTMNGAAQTRTMNGTAQTRTITSAAQNQTSSQFVSSGRDVSKTPSKPPECLLRERVESGDSGGVPDITMKEAVVYLSNLDPSYQQCGASYIQHSTFTEDKAKEEVLTLGGIPPLVALMRSTSVPVHQTASAALRNLSFRSNSNKEEIHRCGGITDAVTLLRETDSAEIEKQLTGLLWNLSSVNSLKPDLLKSAVPVLVERVILPHTAGPGSGKRDGEVFFHVTGCLRNLSSAKQTSRQAMRKCRGLIDSLVKYVTECVEEDKPDDKSLENCVCILHNLTFQLEAEAPSLFNMITSLAKPAKGSGSLTSAGPIGCFSPQSRALAQEQHFDFPVVEDPQPLGPGWLIHSKTMQNYLVLLGSSGREETQEACCGALQNLTVNEGIVSNVMSHIIVQKLDGLRIVRPLLKSEKVNVQKNTVGLVGNLSKNSGLHSVIARKVLPELLGILSDGAKEGNVSDDTLALACQTSSCLLMKEPEMNKHLLTNNLINSLNDLSHNEYLPKSRKSASLLLYNLWTTKDLQGYLKKQGMTKSSFVNDVTTKEYKSAQVVD